MTAHDEQTEALARVLRGDVPNDEWWDVVADVYRAAAERARAAGWLSPEEVAAERHTAKINAWDEGHTTDEHGYLLCDCPNPYRAAAIRATDTKPALDTPLLPDRPTAPWVDTDEHNEYRSGYVAGWEDGTASR